MAEIILNRPNWLGSAERLVRKTIQVPANYADYVTEVDAYGNERKIVPSGSYISTPYKGLLFNDVDITNGASEGSLVIGGYYIDAKLPKTVATHASDLAAQGLHAIVEGATTRPDFGSVGIPALEMGAVTVSTVNLSWTKVDGAISYEVFKSATETGTYVKVGDVAQGDTPTYATEENGWFKVRAIGDNLYSTTSDFSAAKQVTSHA